VMLEILFSSFVFDEARTDIQAPLTKVVFCHQNQNENNIGNFTNPLKPHNIGTHLKGIETSFQVVPLFLKSFHFWVSSITFWNVLKIPSVLKGLIIKRLSTVS
jgi:hypothetical protein